MLPPETERISRLAPTPSGYLHAGNAVNFLVNELLAGAKGRLLLRIDDLDRDRHRSAYVEDVFRTLDWLGIEPTDGPSGVEDFERNWSQLTRLPLYERALAELRYHPLVFACRCSRRELAGADHPHGCRLGVVDFDAAEVSWRVDTRRLSDPEVTFDYLASGRPVRVNIPETMPDFAIRQRNGMPSYQLACTVDDLHFGINVCARGQDLLPSTAAQWLLSDLLGFPSLFGRTWFFHHPLLESESGDKLSKSSGAGSVRELGAGDWTPAKLRERAGLWTALIRR